jgi:hypothetical protein
METMAKGWDSNPRQPFGQQVSRSYSQTLAAMLQLSEKETSCPRKEGCLKSFQEVDLRINQIARTAKRKGFHHRLIKKIMWEAELDLACFVQRTNLLCP